MADAKKPEAKKIDPFDVEALEKSLNDSATRVSTIWISFLIFSLYLLTAATTVTHRQLFLAEPVKLPVLNIDLPLWGFFWLAAILFVIFHAYVLIQLILLARTAAAYNVAVAKLVERENLSADENIALRQRLANTLFAQILAGSPREREGWFGSLLKAMAWITLVIGPLLILLTFQFAFLPYHSHLATWTHRLLILLEFVVAFQLWPLVLNPQRDFHRPDLRSRIRQTTVHLVGLFTPSHHVQARRGLLPRLIPLATTVVFVVLSLWLATFPGEPHINLLTGQSIGDVQCKRSIQQKFGFADLRFDRFVLAMGTLIDHEKLDRIVQATKRAGTLPHQGERTRILSERNFNCGDFSNYTDLRRVDLRESDLRFADFTDAKLDGSYLAGAQLQGASFEAAQLQGAWLGDAALQGATLPHASLRAAVLTSAKLQNASLNFAQLQGASLDEAQLQGASLNSAQLQGASLDGAQLQGASLNSAQLQGASFDAVRIVGAIPSPAQLQGASLDKAQLQGAVLTGAQLQGAVLTGAQLQGAVLTGAQLQGAVLTGAQLQGTSFEGANLDGAMLMRAQVWRASVVDCNAARVVALRNDAVIGKREIRDDKTEPIPATAEEIEKFIASSVAGIPGEDAKESTSNRMHEGLVTSAPDDGKTLAEVWHKCEMESQKVSQQDFDNRHVTILRGVVCDASQHGIVIARGIVRNWVSSSSTRPQFRAKLARALLGEDGKTCAAARDYDEAIKKTLRAAAGPPPAPAAASAPN
jgi:uncharacterized protein YjbI with pentapeptide repeats